MTKIIVSGKTRLNGEVSISGSKNAALPILAATLLLNGETTLHNIPRLNDVITMIRVLRCLGVRAEYSESEPNTVKVWTGNKIKHVAPYELVTKMRASFVVSGPILARTGLSKTPLPGGCAIGSRPVNLHIKGFEALGANVHIEHGFVVAKTAGLKGDRIFLDFPSVGTTENLMMAAALAQGETIIENAAQEPEIVDLANFINAAGGKIKGVGTDTIRILGVTKLHAVKYSIIPDRIEAGTYAIAAAITGGDIILKNVNLEHLQSLIAKLKDAGAEVKAIKPNMLRVKAKKMRRSVDIKTTPYPGFPTDLQPQFMALMTLAPGVSVITENVFENRFMHAHELKRMGANISLSNRNAIVTGVETLSCAPVRVSDLRAGAALLLAALSTQGETILDDTERHIERGYEKIASKMGNLGAKLQFIKNGKTDSN